MTTIHWRSAAGGDWSDGSNWFGGVAPGAGDTAVITAAGTYQATIDSAASVGGITLDSAGATVLAENTLTVGGDLTVEAGTFELTNGTGFEATHGVIAGGTLSAQGGLFDWQGGTLSAVTYLGTLVIGAGQSLVERYGLTVTGTSGSGPGVVDMTAGGGASLRFNGGPGIDNVTIDLGGPGGGSELSFLRGNGKFQAFTLGKGATVDVVGAATITGDSFSLDADGAIVVAPSQSLVIGGGRFFTHFNFRLGGSLTLDSGASVLVQNSTYTTLAGSVLTVNSDATATLQSGVSDPTPIQKLFSTLALDGAGSEVQVTGYSPVPVEQSLNYIGLGGALEVLGGRDWTGDLALANHGLLEIGGGTFSEASIANSGTVEGFGTIAASISDANTRTIAASGGVLEITGAVSGTGRFVIGANSELKLDAAASAITATFTGASGTLAMADPDSLAGKIAGFAVGDTIDLLGIAATSAVRTPGTETVVVSDNGTVVASLTLSGNYTHDSFAVTSDGHGGADISLLTSPAPLTHAMAGMGAAGSIGVARASIQPAPAPLSRLATSGR